MSSGAGDPYLEPASGVLRNLLGITNAAELARAEAALSASRLIDLKRRRLPGRMTSPTTGAYRSSGQPTGSDNSKCWTRTTRTTSSR